MCFQTPDKANGKNISNSERGSFGEGGGGINEDNRYFNNLDML